MSDSGVLNSILQYIATNYPPNITCDCVIVGSSIASPLVAIDLATEHSVVLVLQGTVPYEVKYSYQDAVGVAVFRREAIEILKEHGLVEEYSSGDILVMDLYTLMIKAVARCLERKVKLLLPANFRDVLYTRELRNYVVQGVVVEIGNFTTCIRSRAIVDTTENALVVETALRSVPYLEVPTPDGTVIGLRGYWVEEASRAMIANTRKVLPGIVVCGLAANAVFGSPKPVFDMTSVVLSARKAAQLVRNELRKQ